MNKSSENRRNAIRRFIAAASAYVVMVALFLSPLASLIAEAAIMSPATTVIVQLKDDPAAVWQAKQKKAGARAGDRALAQYRAGLRAKQDQFLSAMTARGINYEVAGVDVPNFDGTNAGRVDMRYTMVLNGMALKVPSSQMSALRSMPQVKSVEPDKMLHVELEKSVAYVRAPQVYGQFQELTPFDTFREGYEGQGMNVAVLDTGIDWTHPMFGGDPTPPRLGLLPSIAAVATNPKVIYYMTFTGGLPDGYGHGTAAASNIGGYLGMAPGPDGLPTTLDDVRVHGVAPQARLMGYKVCLDVGSCLSSSTVMAIEDAVSPMTVTMQPKPIAHVINMSLGGAGGPDDATAVAGDNAALLGTIVVASAGNSGPGEATVGSPAAGRHVIAVGANTDPAGGSNSIDVTDGSQTGMIANLLDGAAAVTSDITNNYVYCGLAETPAACPDSVRGKIALIARGSTYNLPALPVVGSLGTGLFSNKAASAVAKGAVAAVIYNNINGELTAATVRKSTIPILGVSKANGEYLLSQMAGAEISPKSIRINAAKLFTPQMADFSSRGPVQGLGQIKPDVTAPGVGVLSATVRVGTADANTGTMFDPTGYVHASGTSFSGPHVAGAAALVKQAHLDWSPDLVRTALINTATNLRTESGSPTGNDSIIAQGGGLIDVAGAVNTKALMGIAGDGITLPGLLGSHSFGETPILNNRIVNTREVTVTLRDVSGQGGTYSLSTVNNRNVDRPGVTASVPSSVTVPAGGSTTFTASITLDGNQVRDESTLDLQWYVVASSGGKSIHMPMFLRATPSLPDGAGGSSVTENFEGTVLASDAGTQHDTGNFLAEGVTYNDVPFTVQSGTVKVDATLEFTDTAGLDFGLSDLDLYLVDPDGEIIASAAIAGGPERLSAPITRPGEYKYRVYGWLGANVPYTLTSTQTLGAAAPTLNPIAANFVEESTGKRYDFDGSFDVTWTAAGSAEAYEVEQSADGTTWNAIQQLPGSATGISFANLAEGTHSFRVRSIVGGKIGKFVTEPSNVATIIVSRRTEVDATTSVDAMNRSITFPSGSTELVTALKNKSATVYYPNIRFEITSISSAGNSVTVKNADNGGNGFTTVATFDYSQLVGEDFVAGEESGNRTLKFNNPNNVLFTFTARVMANVPVAGGSGFAAASTSSTGSAPAGSANDSSPLTVRKGTASKLFKFTVDPISGTVNVQMLR